MRRLCECTTIGRINEARSFFAAILYTIHHHRYRPLNRGSRFSKKDFIASCTSSVP